MELWGPWRAKKQTQKTIDETPFVRESDKGQIGCGWGGDEYSVRWRWTLDLRHNMNEKGMNVMWPRCLLVDYIARRPGGIHSSPMCTETQSVVEGDHWRDVKITLRPCFLTFPLRWGSVCLSKSIKNNVLQGHARLFLTVQSHSVQGVVVWAVWIMLTWRRLESKRLVMLYRDVNQEVIRWLVCMWTWRDLETGIVFVWRHKKEGLNRLAWSNSKLYPHYSVLQMQYSKCPKEVRP